MGIIVELKVMRERKKNLMRLGIYYLYVFSVWASFRYWVRLPEVIEELWFKPVIWLLPLFWWRMSLGGKPKLFNNKWLLSGGAGALTGIFYFGLIKLSVYIYTQNFGEMGWSLNLLGVALVIAIVEELTFSGFVLGFLDKFNNNRLINLLVLGLMVVGVHLPINLFVFGLRGGELMSVLMWLFSMAIVNGWIRQKTGNVVGSVIARFGLMLAIL